MTVLFLYVPVDKEVECQVANYKGRFDIIKQGHLVFFWLVSGAWKQHTKYPTISKFHGFTKFGAFAHFGGLTPSIFGPCPNTHHVHTQPSSHKISVSTSFYIYFFTAVNTDGVAGSNGLTTWYKAHSGPNPCHNLRPNDNTHH